jgi:transcriptional regulator with XRE-family HTH domain
MEFRETIRTYREKAGWTKKKLAELVGVTQPYIVQIENDGKVPSDSVVLRLADCLGVQRRELLFAAYRARAPKDLKDCFSTVFDDFIPSGHFEQPFIVSRGNHIESPEFVIRDLGTSVGGGFHISLIETKSEEAELEEHSHSVPVTLVVSQGSFTVEAGGMTRQLSLGGEVSMTIPASVPHTIRAQGLGKMLSIALGRVVRPGEQVVEAAAEVRPR